MKDTEIIERYLLNQMSRNEWSEFEERLKNDPGHQSLVDEFKSTFEALRRTWVKDSLGSLDRMRKLKQFSLALSLILILTAAFFMVLKNKTRHDDNSHKAIEQSIVRESPTTPDIIDSTLQTQVHPFSAGGANSTKANPTSPVATPEYPSETIFNPFLGASNQTFTIDNTKDACLSLAGGTKIFIDSGSLISASLETDLRNVRFNIREFTNYYDLWLEKLHTDSSERRLISGGACHISAEWNGQEVFIQEGKSYKVLFPGPYDSLMNSFYGKWEANKFDWQHESLQVPTTSKTPPTKGNDLKTGKSPADMNLTFNDTIWFFEPVVMDEGYINGQYTFNSLTEKTDFSSTFKPLSTSEYIDIKKMFIRKKNLLIRFHVDSTGVLDRYDYNFIVNKKAEKSIKKKADSICHTRIDLQGNQFDERIVNVTLLPKFRIDSKDSVLTDSSLKKMHDFKSAKTAYNAIFFNKFGYINCDHFALDKDLIDMTIHSSIGKLQDVRIFFMDDFSVISGDISGTRATIRNIPKNDSVLIIGISEDGKRMFLARRSCSESSDGGTGEPFDALKIKQTLLGLRQDH